MRAAVLGADGSVTLQDVEPPVPAADQLLVRVRAAGLNRADLSARAAAGQAGPVIAGLELARRGRGGRRGGQPLAARRQGCGPGQRLRRTSAAKRRRCDAGARRPQLGRSRRMQARRASESPPRAWPDCWAQAPSSPRRQPRRKLRPSAQRSGCCRARSCTWTAGNVQESEGGISPVLLEADLPHRPVVLRAGDGSAGLNDLVGCAECCRGRLTLHCKAS
jgi:hypothetical protein